MAVPEPAASLRKADGVAIITLSRPHALNAVNAELSAAVGAALAEFDADDDLRVAVITGSGRAFCAGADLKALGAGESVLAPEHPEWGFAGVVGHEISKPVLAAINGLAFGGGTEIVFACDLAVMSAEAKLGLPEVKRGLIAAAGGLIELPRQMPIKLAMEAALTGEPIDAQTALRWGLVNRVVPPDEVLPVALALAAAIATNAPLAARATKRLVRRSLGTGAEWDVAVKASQRSEMDALRASRDAAEGTRAFAEKRVPVWSGT